jgi:hypothetical protein
MRSEKLHVFEKTQDAPLLRWISEHLVARAVQRIEGAPRLNSATRTLEPSTVAAARTRVAFPDARCVSE